MSFFRKVLTAVFGNSSENHKIIIVGLNAAGKTTILYKLRGRGDEVYTTIPTIGFNVETLDRRDMNMTCWDVGGCDKIRPLWRHYYQDLSLLIFVIDSNDRDRLPNAGEELDQFTSDEAIPTNIPLLIIANKQDLPNSMRTLEITEKLQLHRKFASRRWYVCPTCAITGDGLADALQWMKYAIRNHRQPVPAPVIAETVVPHAVVVESSDKIVDEVAAAKARERVLNRQTILDEWLRRARSEVTAAVTDDGLKSANATFLAGVENATLDSWDHYTHIKLGYLVLTSGVSREEATLRVCQLISSFISRSNRTNGRSYHCTMTHFWCHMIALQLSRNASAASSLVGFMESLQSDTVAVELWDGKLFTQYYSNGVLFGCEARNSFVSPDLSPFPIL